MICEKSMLDIIFKTKTSRFFLPFILLTFTLLINNNHKNYVLLSLFTFFDSIIILSNFNSLVTMSNAKTLYFEDLYSEPVNYKKKIIKNIQKSKKFSDKFLIFQQLILSVTISFVVDYIVIKYKMNNYQPMEFLGLIGGILSLHLKISNHHLLK